MKPGKWLGLALLLAAACTGQGQEPAPTPAPTAAPPADSQNALNRRAAESFVRADTELNAVYARLMTSLPPERRGRLQEAQRAWIAFRDADGRFVASAMEGGSAYPMLYAGRRARLTRERAQALSEWLGTEKPR